MAKEFIKTAILKNGGSHYARIPVEVVKELQLVEDNQILVNFEKYNNVIKEQCEINYQAGNGITITNKYEEEIIGEIVSIDKYTVKIMSSGVVHAISYPDINTIKVNQREVKT